MLGYFDFSAPAASGSQVINAPGSYFRYFAGSAGGADNRIIVRGKGGLYVVLKPGQAVRLPGDLVGDYWQIENFLKTGNITGAVAIGSGQVDDSTITGDVNVVDNGLSRTLSGAAFLGTSATNAVAAQYPCGQLWNPAGSGKNLMLSGFLVSSAIAQSIAFGSNAAALANLMTAAYVGSKYSGGAAGVGQARHETNVALIIANFWQSFQISSNAPQVINLKEQVVIPPGRGALLQGFTVNSALSCSFEWVEFPI